MGNVEVAYARFLGSGRVNVRRRPAMFIVPDKQQT